MGYPKNSDPHFLFPLSSSISPTCSSPFLPLPTSFARQVSWWSSTMSTCQPCQRLSGRNPGRTWDGWLVSILSWPFSTSRDGWCRRFFSSKNEGRVIQVADVDVDIQVWDPSEDRIFLGTPKQNWLVVWNINFIFPYIGNNHPNWRTIFFRGVAQPPTRKRHFYFCASFLFHVILEKWELSFWEHRQEWLIGLALSTSRDDSWGIRAVVIAMCVGLSNHCIDGGFQLVTGVPLYRWMVYVMEHPI